LTWQKFYIRGGKSWFSGFPQFDTSVKWALAYGGFLRKTAINAARAAIGGLSVTRVRPMGDTDG
jgi:hypothetical protein